MLLTDEKPNFSQVDDKFEELCKFIVESFTVTPAMQILEWTLYTQWQNII